MDQIVHLLDILRHLDKTIGGLITNYGFWSYGILFLVIFAETGFVVTPFLPGDTLLFAAGIFAHPVGDQPGFNIWLLLLILTAAPVCGDTVNYHIGKWIGPRMFSNPKARFLKASNLDRTHAFFERHGGKTVIFARWVPIVRTFAPFVAGMGAMPFKKFITFGLLGSFIWVWVCVGAGYFFGRIPAVRENFEVAMLGMIGVTVLPLIFEGLRHRAKQRNGKG